MYQGSSLDSTYRRLQGSGLSHFHGKRFAVVLTNGSSHLALRGIARYVEDTEGNALRIEVENHSQSEQGQPVFVIREEACDGCFVPDHEYGCDFQLRLNADSVQENL